MGLRGLIVVVVELKDPAAEVGDGKIVEF